MLKRIALGAAVLLIAGAVASSPAMADQKEGWFVFLEGIDTQVLDTDQPIGTVGTFGDPAGDPPSPFFAAEHKTVDWGTNVNGRLGFGKQWANGNKLTLSYWEFDNDESGSMDLSGVDAFYSPFGYYYYYGYGGGTRAPLGGGTFSSTFSRFDSNVKASSIDVDFSHVHSLNDHFDFEWNLGMKFASYEDTTTVATGYTYTDTGGVATDYTYDEKAHTESDMWGFKAGARGMYNFGPRFSLTAGLNVAKLQGGVESTSTISSTFVGSTPALTDHFNDDNRSGTITDYDIMGVFHLGEHFDLSVGYEQSTWQGISRDLMRSHWGQPDRDEVGFAGWKVGVKWRFGG